MRVLIVIALIMSVSAIAQTRVKENIKQQTVTAADGQEKPGKRPSGKPRK